MEVTEQTLAQRLGITVSEVPLLMKICILMREGAAWRSFSSESWLRMIHARTILNALDGYRSDLIIQARIPAIQKVREQFQLCAKKAFEDEA